MAAVESGGGLAHADAHDVAQMYFDNLMRQASEVPYLSSGLQQQPPQQHFAQEQGIQLEQRMLGVLREVDKSLADCQQQVILLGKQLSECHAIQLKCQHAMAPWSYFLDAAIRDKTKDSVRLYALKGPSNMKTPLSKTSFHFASHMQIDSSGEFEGVIFSDGGQTPSLTSDASMLSIGSGPSDMMSPISAVSRNQRYLSRSDHRETSFSEPLLRLDSSTALLLSDVNSEDEDEEEEKDSPLIPFRASALPEMFQNGAAYTQLHALYQFIQLAPATLEELAAMFPALDTSATRLLLDLLVRKKFIRAIKNKNNKKSWCAA
jgi:hypothetical protein